jgi:hypothetical protein
VEVLERVGVFHFGSEQDDPVGALSFALDLQNVRGPGVLIVLPEAFNICERLFR